MKIEIPQVPLPLGAVPAGLLDTILEVQHFMKVPAEMALASALGTLSLAAQGLYDVRRPNDLVSPCGLFLITIADSGERKTSCDRLFMKPIQDWDAAAVQAEEEERQQYSADFQSWSIKAHAIRSALRDQAKKEVANVD